MENLPLDIWGALLRKDYLRDCHWRKLGETCKFMYNILQYLLSNDNYPSTRTIHIPEDTRCNYKIRKTDIDIYNIYQYLLFSCRGSSCHTYPLLRDIDIRTYDISKIDIYNDNPHDKSFLYCIYICTMLNKLYTHLPSSHKWTISLEKNSYTILGTSHLYSLDDNKMGRIFTPSLYNIIGLIPKGILIDLTIDNSDDVDIHSLTEKLSLVSDQLVGFTLAHVDLNNSCIINLTRILQQMTSLTKLNISENRISPEDTKPFFDSIGQLTQLTSLNVFGMNLSRSNAALLLDALITTTNLTTLSLANNNINDVYMLINLLTRLPRLNFLDLNMIGLDCNDVNTLAPTLISMTQLRTLYISNYPPYDRKKEGIQIMTCMVSKLTQLTSLTLGLFAYEYENKRLLTRKCKQLPNLTELDKCKKSNRYNRYWIEYI